MFVYAQKTVKKKKKRTRPGNTLLIHFSPNVSTGDIITANGNGANPGRRIFYCNQGWERARREVVRLTGYVKRTKIPKWGGGRRWLVATGSVFFFFFFFFFFIFFVCFVFFFFFFVCFFFFFFFFFWREKAHFCPGVNGSRRVAKCGRASPDTSPVEGLLNG